MNNFKKLTPNEAVFGLIYYLLQLIVISGIIVVVNMMLPNPMPEAMVNFIYFSINFVAVLVIFRKFLVANFRAFTQNLRFVLCTTGIGYLIYIASNFLVAMLITAIDPAFSNVNNEAFVEMLQDHFVLISIGTVLLVPIAEECFYRGLIFRSLYDVHPVLAYGLSMVLFSLVHVLGYVTVADFLTLLLCFIQYLPVSFVLAWTYRRSGTIFAPVLIHTVVNLTAMLFMR